MSNNERHLVRAAVYLVFEQDGKTLLLRRHNTGYRDGEYTLPAGHVEANETFVQTCIREAEEEVKLQIQPEDLSLVHVMQRHEKGVNVIDYYFLVKQWTGTPQIGEPHKADDLQWIPAEEVQLHTIHFVGKALDCIARGVTFSHDGIEAA